MRAVRNGKVKAARCGGALRPRGARAWPSSAPTEGAVLTDGENLPVRVTRARQPRRHRHAPRRAARRRPPGAHVGRRHACSSSWFGFRSIGYGDHAVEIRALDQAQNVTVRRLTVRKVTPASFGDSAAPARALALAAAARRRVRVRIAVRSRDRGAAGLRKITLYVDGVPRAHDQARRRALAPAGARCAARQAPADAARGGPRGQRHALQALHHAPLAAPRVAGGSRHLGRGPGTGRDAARAAAAARLEHGCTARSASCAERRGSARARSTNFLVDEAARAAARASTLRSPAHQARNAKPLEHAAALGPLERRRRRGSGRPRDRPRDELERVARAPARRTRSRSAISRRSHGPQLGQRALEHLVGDRRPAGRRGRRGSAATSARTRTAARSPRSVTSSMPREYRAQYAGARDLAAARGVADGHGRRARARGARDRRRGPVPRAPARARAAVHAADQQLDLHAARPRGAPARERARRARVGDLDLRAGDRALPRATSGPAARRTSWARRA